MTRFIATFAGVGLLRPAPGTWGSLAAVALGYLLHRLGGFPLLGFATLALFLVGFWAVRIETADDPAKDPGEFVVDEVVGQWIALFPLSAGLWAMGAPPALFPWPGWVGGFLMFRLFDIWKPWLVGRADRLHSPLGLMLDDVVAGLFAAVAVAVAAAISHGLMGM
ncbi:phosphatidylglycerophosphatase A family protein [Amaricoccus solimangrovi]|uniref:Phosphatidylglycerophosphatase A n=1 Tax=Amaricoccus solimangrovi TaxID=2589815 RepID=A0A501X160_9RHOB|nr:phosphatidylglycerophosphatase A [Amaricoccus solimangrovi]TPE53156.1 phosphatidylglycerophosphatase A [Amaricoccus solimangrovi]